MSARARAIWACRRAWTWGHDGVGWGQKGKVSLCNGLQAQKMPANRVVARTQARTQENVAYLSLPESHYQQTPPPPPPIEGFRKFVSLAMVRFFPTVKRASVPSCKFGSFSGCALIQVKQTVFIQWKSSHLIFTASVYLLMLASSKTLLFLVTKCKSKKKHENRGGGGGIENSSLKFKETLAQDLQ